MFFFVFWGIGAKFSLKMVVFEIQYECFLFGRKVMFCLLFIYSVLYILNLSINSENCVVMNIRTQERVHF